MQLKLSTNIGQASLKGLENDMVMEDFQDLLEAHSGIAAEDQEVFVGEPPEPLKINRGSARKTLVQMGLSDGDIISVKPRDGGPAPSMVGLSSRRSLSRTSMNKMGSFQKKGSFVKASNASQANLEDQLQGDMENSTLDDSDPMFNDMDNGFTPRRSFTGMPRAVSQGDVLGQEHSRAKQDNPHSMPDADQRGSTEAVAVAATTVAAPRRKRGVRAEPPSGTGGALGEHFTAPRPGKTDGGFGDWANAPDASCACINCMLAASPGLSMGNEHANQGRHVFIARRVMPDDNGCLFTACAYVMEGFRSKGPELRKVIADAVLADSSTYNEAFLGKKPQEYASWIKDSSKWGGAIELSILSKYYGREIAAYDIKTQRCDVYGEDKNYRERVMLIYDGLHYDALSIAAFQDAPEEIDVSVFDPKGPQGPPAHQGAQELTKKAHTQKEYTDTGSFALRCQICQIGVVGETEALEHAKSTGHANFSEYNAVSATSQPSVPPQAGVVSA